MSVDLDALHASCWSVEQAAGYAARCATLRGCNYVPRNSVNTTQMWQDLDATVITQELGWGRAIGLNSVRVFVQYLLFEHEPQALLDAMARFLDLAAEQGMSTMVVLLDDCWGPEPALGEQLAPIPGVHNSRWTSSPGVTRRRQEHWPTLARYVTGVVRHFAGDERIVAWDLYNEAAPTSRPLAEAAFAWAREAAPTQPLTSCWQADDLSDISTFHSYEDSSGEGFARALEAAGATGRPAVCTECLARTRGNNLARLLPAFAERDIGWYVWGLVSGATQTRFPWGWPAGGPKPYAWFHDLLYPDGTPYRQDEIDLIREYADRGSAAPS